jgi:hypothetical protein
MRWVRAVEFICLIDIFCAHKRGHGTIHEELRMVGVAGGIDSDSRCRLLDSAVVQQTKDGKVEARIQRLFQGASS